VLLQGRRPLGERRTGLKLKGVLLLGRTPQRQVLPPGSRRRAEAIDVLLPGAEAKGVLPLGERRTGRMPQGECYHRGTPGAKAEGVLLLGRRL